MFGVELGSTSNEAVTSAVLDRDPVAFTEATIVSVTEAWLARLPIFQMLVALLYVPWLAVEDIYVNPLGI